MLRIEELIPSLNSDFKIERHRNSYGHGFGQYYGLGYPLSYGGSAIPSSELNCYDLIYKNDTVLGEISFVPLKHIEGITRIVLYGYLKNTVKDQLRNAVCSITRLENRVSMQKVYSITIPNINAQTHKANQYYLPPMTDAPASTSFDFYDELDLANFIYDYTQNLLSQKQMTIDLLKKYNQEFRDGVQDIENRMTALAEERDHLGEHLQSKIEKEFLIKSI